MLVVERQRLILDRLRRQGVIAVRDMARELGVPQVTVRRDMSALAGRGLMVRTHGGAVLTSGLEKATCKRPCTSPLGTDAVDIAFEAARMVNPGDSVFLGGGSTTLALAHELADVENLTVVTNSLLTCGALSDAPGIELILVGGSLLRANMTLVGVSVESSLWGLRPSIAFLAGDGMTANHGLSTGNLAQANADRAAAAASERVVALVEGSAIGRANLCQIVPCRSIDVVITGSEPNAEEIGRIKDVGVEVRDIRLDRGGLNSA